MALNEVLAYLDSSPHCTLGEVRAILEQAQARKAKALGILTGAQDHFLSYAYALDYRRQPCALRICSQVYLELFDRPWFDAKQHYADTMQQLLESAKAIEFHIKEVDRGLPDIRQSMEDALRLSQRGCHMLQGLDEFMELDVQECIERFADAKDMYESALSELWSMRAPAREAKDHVQSSVTRIKASYEYFVAAKKTPHSLGAIEHELNQAVVLLRE